jgi:hypothetical protein
MSAVYLSSVGAELEQIETHTREFQRAIEEMNQKLPSETRILEGTSLQPYTEVRSALENELSQPKLTEEQWKNALQSGSLITDRIPISTPVLSSLFSIARDLDLKYAEQDRQWAIRHSSDTSTNSSTDSCSGKLEDCGTETDAMNECSECTVPMTSELMLGTPSEER